METLLTVIFWGGLGIVGLVVCIAIAVWLSNELVEAADFVIQGKPEGLILTSPKKLKDDSGYKTDPLPVFDGYSGMM